MVGIMHRNQLTISKLKLFLFAFNNVLTIAFRLYPPGSNPAFNPMDKNNALGNNSLSQVIRISSCDHPVPVIRALRAVRQAVGGSNL